MVVSYFTVQQIIVWSLAMDTVDENARTTFSAIGVPRRRVRRQVGDFALFGRGKPPHRGPSPAINLSAGFGQVR
jgi:hypothetical protein